MRGLRAHDVAPSTAIHDWRRIASPHLQMYLLPFEGKRNEAHGSAWFRCSPVLAEKKHVKGATTNE